MCTPLKSADVMLKKCIKKGKNEEDLSSGDRVVIVVDDVVLISPFVRNKQEIFNSEKSKKFLK